MVSAPNISGTSVKIVVPPLEINKSEKPPTVGLALIPDSPSEPPHFIPMINSLASISSLLSWLTTSAKSAMMSRESLISSSCSWATKNLTRSVS